MVWFEGIISGATRELNKKAGKADAIPAISQSLCIPAGVGILEGDPKYPTRRVQVERNPLSVSESSIRNSTIPSSAKALEVLQYQEEQADED